MMVYCFTLGNKNGFEILVKIMGKQNFVWMGNIFTLANLYVDLLVFTRIDGTS